MTRDPMFNPQLLQSFVAICDSMSFTRAAERVCLSQPTVSQQEETIQRLSARKVSHRPCRSAP